MGYLHNVGFLTSLARRLISELNVGGSIYGMDELYDDLVIFMELNETL